MADGSGEYVVLIEPLCQHDGRRRWVVMATLDADEYDLALVVARGFRDKGHSVAIAAIEWEGSDD